MTLDDAVSCWQSQKPADSPRSDSDILALVRRRSQLFDANIRKRDWREIGAMIFVIVVVAPALFLPSWTARAGALIILCGCGLIYWKLRSARRNHPVSVAMPLVEVLQAERAKIDAQITLLESVLWWYIAPPVIGAVLIVVGTAGATWFTLGYVVFAVAVALAIYAANRRTVRHHLQPARDELSALLQQTLA
jgi:hypothetical protein